MTGDTEDFFRICVHFDSYIFIERLKYTKRVLNQKDFFFRLTQRRKYICTLGNREVHKRQILEF